MCAFPLHVWTLLLAFRDVSWISERTNAWDAVGVLSYGLVFAFLESIVIFLVIALLGYLVSLRWDETHRIALLGLLILILACWAMYAQAYFIWNIPLPGGFLAIVSRSAHPLRILYLVALAALIVTFLPATILVLTNAVFGRIVRSVIDKVSFLTGFYLVLDALSLIIVIIRNV